MEKENWINEVMQSCKGMKPMEANPFLFEKIAHKIELNKMDEMRATSFFKGWAVAASLVILLNIISFTHILKDKPSHQKEMGYQALSKEMGLIQTNNY